MEKILKLLSLNKKLSLVTGANGKLGRVFCDTLSQLGSDLIIVDRNYKEINAQKSKISKKYKNKIYAFDCNFEDLNERKYLIKECKKFKKLDLLINNAAFVGENDLLGWNANFSNQNLKTWERCMNVNLTSIFDLTKNLIPILMKSKDGNIINICSIYALHGPDWKMYKDTTLGNPAAYAVSKAGLLHFTKWLACTLAPTIRVNSISPGGLKRNQSDKFVKAYTNKTLLNRMAYEKDLIGAVIFLATNMSNYITGQNISVDGGWGIN